MNIDLIENASKLDTETNRLDIRRDLHLFCGYVRDREVKRGHRDNALSKADARRLAKLLSDPEAENEIEEDGYSTWVDFVDQTRAPAWSGPLRHGRRLCRLYQSVAKFP